jgi:PAS domain S-box-containing protein
VYAAAGKLGLALASLHQSASPVWPPTGIAIAAVLLFGPRMWPGIFAGAFLVNVTTVGTVATSLGVASGNTLEALLAGWLVNRLVGGAHVFDRARDVLMFALVAGILAPVVSATIGVSSLALGGFAEWSRFSSIWLTWWIGDLVSAVVVAPLIVVWGRAAPTGERIERRGETALMFAVVLAVDLMVFSGALPEPFDSGPVAFLCLPPLLWPIFRLEPRAAVGALFTLAAVALMGTLRGLGPFALRGLNDSLLVMQAFVAVITVMNLVLLALVGERRRAEQRLRRSQVALESRFLEIEDLYRAAPVGLCLLDRELRFVRINARLAEINGLSAAAHIGRTLREVVPDLADRAEPLMRSVLARGEPLLDVELEGTTGMRPGVVRHWIESYHPQRDAAGVVVGLNVVVQEVTPMKEAEAAVRRSERELIELFESASQGMAWIAADGTILRANRAELRLLGYGVDEYVGHHLSEFHESAAVGNDLQRRLAIGERVEEFPARLRCKDGSLRDVVIDSSSFEGDPSMRAQIFVRDVTERKRAERALAAWQVELERRVADRTSELELARGRLHAEAEARKRLEAEVAAAVESEHLRLGQELHEGLGQELTGIAYLMATLQRALAAMSPSQAEAALRLEEMITRSVERTRILAKAFYPVEMETLGLLASLEEIADNTMDSFGVRCRVSVDADQRCAELRGPIAIQFFRIAQEAVLNAVKHGQAHRVDIDVGCENGDLVMRVVDDGVGLPEDLEKVEGAGLRIMRYRAGILGGVLDLRALPTGGSMVRCSAPLPAA